MHTVKMPLGILSDIGTHHKLKCLIATPLRSCGSPLVVFTFTARITRKGDGSYAGPDLDLWLTIYGHLNSLVGLHLQVRIGLTLQ